MSIRDEQQEVRQLLTERLRLDLLGPTSADEELVQNRETREGDTPLSKYLVGILYPSDSLVTEDEDDGANEADDSEEDDTPEPQIQITGIPKPSSIGLTFAVTNDVKEIQIEFRYGLYDPTPVAPASKQGNGTETNGETEKLKPTILWRRKQINQPVKLALPVTGSQSFEGGGKGEWLCRRDGSLFIITAFLRNSNPRDAGPDDPEQCLYQPEIIVLGSSSQSAPIVSRAHKNPQVSYDPDLESYRLLYRDKPEFGVGHGCAAVWDSNAKDCPPNRARLIRTDLIPVYDVPTTEARGAVGLQGLQMKVLATARNGREIKSALKPLTDEYEAWIQKQYDSVSALPIELRSKATEHLGDCQNALARIQEGLELIATDPLVFEAFQFSNRAMMLQRRKSVEAANFQKGIGRVFESEDPVWRPFQMAFILLNVKGIAVRESRDREIADLLWFPTGGGKTEAYLGLAAFTMGLRRLRQVSGPGPQFNGDGGITVLMRYTLRLLTIQQFQRAATLLCACEILRKQESTRFGQEPFSIGLWVGGGATPNKIDQAPDPQYGREPGALQALENFDPNNEPATGNPVQLRTCPWCGESISYKDYRVIRELLHLQIRCPNEECEFHGSASEAMSGIPAYVVDEDIYLRCPTLLIGTVDKFARLPWDEKTKALFGRVDRCCDRHGFIPEGDSHVDKSGHPKSGLFPKTAPPKAVQAFLPPELIIQDELHLITGPLGSLMGLYERAVDYLCSHVGHRPKVVASTATIRRYQDQIRSLFDREARQFPPPGLIAGESFFAAEDRTKPGRTYVGLCAPGKSMKTAAVRTLASMMHTAEMERRIRPTNVVDPYWTVVYYFNSLRELGGAIRLIDDDIRQRLIYLANADGIAPPRAPERRPELTSRIPAKDIPTLLRDMEQTLQTGKALDVLLSTNMISVGVDIQRFGLMLVTGQPKTSAEYIQATSRVGRQVPGVIFTLYNWSRPRDLSHYERFITYHSMLYRHVEASSVTPYSSRARDKALHAVFIGLLRLLDPRLSQNNGAQNFNPRDSLVQEVKNYLLDRVKSNDPDEFDGARDQLNAFIDGWVEQQQRYQPDLKFRSPGGVGLNTPRSWLLQPAEEGQGSGFPKATLNSLREVEKTSGLYFKNFRRAGFSRNRR